MDEFKGTPGPWASLMIFCTETQECALSVANREYFETQENGPVVALISPVKKVNEIDIANAKLITAAPDLLQALIFCRSVIESQGLFDLSERLAFKTANEAIAKALGKEVQP